MPSFSQAKSGLLDLETGKAATVSTGRPHLEQLLGDLVFEGESAVSMGVIVSGTVSCTFAIQLPPYSLVLMLSFDTDGMKDQRSTASC